MGPEVRGQVVRYGNDNYAACRVVEFGSMKKDCHMVAKRMPALVDKFDIKLEMVWRRRNTEEITLSDRLSKDFDLSEYRMTMESFKELECYFHFFYFVLIWINIYIYMFFVSLSSCYGHIVAETFLHNFLFHVARNGL